MSSTPVMKNISPGNFLQKKMPCWIRRLPAADASCVGKMYERKSAGLPTDRRIIIVLHIAPTMAG